MPDLRATVLELSGSCGASFHGSNGQGASVPNEQIAWDRVVRSLVIVAGEAAQAHIAVADVLNLVDALRGVEDAQVAVLQRVESVHQDVLKIRNDTDLIRTGPFRSAREHLDTAIRNASDATECAHHLQQAQDLLIQALGRCASDQEYSVVHFSLGVVAAARGQQNEARYQMKQAYDTSVAVATNLFPLATEKLKAYIPFAVAVARAYNAIDPKAGAGSPEYRKTDYGQPDENGYSGEFSLRWIYTRPDGVEVVRDWEMPPGWPQSSIAYLGM